MIKLEVKEYCHNCPEFKADVDVERFGVITETVIFCEHKSRCKNMFDYFMKTYEVSLKPVII